MDADARTSAGSASSSSARNRSTTRDCRAESSRDSPTILPARSVASRPTSLRSETTACWRSASIWRWAPSTIRVASECALSRTSVAIAAASARASSRIWLASVRASASCALYSASAASASFCAFSASSMPPSIEATRSA